MSRAPVLGKVSSGDILTAASRMFWNRIGTEVGLLVVFSPSVAFIPRIIGHVVSN
jgi:hypothetical protein